MAQSSNHLLRGTLDLLILKSLCWGAQHGYGIAEWIEGTTDDQLRIMEGTIYPALHRMAKRDWIAAEWRASENNRRAKYYQLTAKGKVRLDAELSQWKLYTEAMTKVINASAPALT